MIGVLSFPGSTCEGETGRALSRVTDLEVRVLRWWEDVPTLRGVVLPGGFTFGDHLRPGAIVARGPLMGLIRAHWRAGTPILGICNGFQILAEAGLLPGGLLRNRRGLFVCRPVFLRVEDEGSVLTRGLGVGRVLRLPVAHWHGRLEGVGQGARVVLRYCDEGGRLTAEANPNGSLGHGAALAGPAGNVVGLMPHPERAMETLQGSEDGMVLLRAFAAACEAREPFHPQEGPVPFAFAPRHAPKELVWDEMGDMVSEALLSEHCCYRSSREILRALPSAGPGVIVGPGENAGAVRLAGGLAAVFKAESHNHPSFIEPRQGAATGVGGILRDVVAMGARPIALLNALCFGRPEPDRSRHLVRGVVEGIAWYGNCVGVPTVGGHVVHHRAFDRNILVNVMALAIAGQGDLKAGRADRAGQGLILVGAPTGPDGLGGASMASKALPCELRTVRPAVQVANPFAGKELLEATLAMAALPGVAAVQDLGAAGLVGGAAGLTEGLGADLDMDAVPLRVSGLTVGEALVSETQERMLLAVEPGAEGNVLALARRYGLAAARVGSTAGHGEIRVRGRGGEAVAFVLSRLQDPPCPPRLTSPLPALNDPPRPGAAPPNLEAFCLRLLGQPNGRSKAWIYEQYDYSVQGRTLGEPGGSASLLALPGLSGALAVSFRLSPVDGADLAPEAAGARAVAEATRALACCGAFGLGITDCLNLADPSRPQVMAQLQGMVQGIGRVCRALDVPVVSGNVSFHNETDGIPIPPVASIGAVGWLPDPRVRVGWTFRQGGETIVLLGTLTSDLRGGLWQRGGPGLPAVSAGAEARLQAAARLAVQRHLVSSIRPLGRGGLLGGLAKACLDPGGRPLRGARIQLESWPWLFAPSPAVLVSLPQEHVDELMALARGLGTPARAVGRVTDEPAMEVEGLVRLDLSQVGQAMRPRPPWEA